MNHQPVLITPDKLRTLSPSTQTKLYLGGIWGSVESGQTWLATDGRRTVISANSVNVLYLLTGSKKPGGNVIYAQSAEGFRGEVTTYPLIEGARRAEKIARIAEFETHVLMGAFSVSSGGALALVMGLDALDFCVKNQANFSKWGRMLTAVLATRTVLKRHAPTLYDKLIEATLIAVGTTAVDSLRNLPEAAAKDPKIVARLVGTILGKLGQKVLTERAGALKTIFAAVLLPLATKALGAIPGAVQITLDDRTQAASSIITALERSDVTLSAEDARKIVDEMAAKPNELRGSLEELRRAFEAGAAR
jgi:hypothetical protein